MAAVDGASPIFSEVEEKQEMVESALRRCTSDELKSIAAGLTNTEATAYSIASVESVNLVTGGVITWWRRGNLEGTDRQLRCGRRSGSTKNP